MQQNRFAHRFDKYNSLCFYLLLLVGIYYSFQFGYESVLDGPLLFGGEAIPQVKTPKVLHEKNRTFMPNIETISWSPRAQVYYNFFTQEECDRIRKYAEPHVRRSMVVDPKNSSNSIVENSRTSSGFVLDSNHIPELPELEKATKQIEDWVRIPAKNSELFYVLRYQHGEQYEPHTGPLGPVSKAFLGTAGNRVATVLVYLHTPEEGGTTLFPIPKIACNATAGTALLFWDYTPDGQPDWNSLHGGMPVIKADKIQVYD